MADFRDVLPRVPRQPYLYDGPASAQVTACAHHRNSMVCFSDDSSLRFLPLHTSPTGWTEVETSGRAPPATTGRSAVVSPSLRLWSKQGNTAPPLRRPSMSMTMTMSGTVSAPQEPPLPHFVLVGGALRPFAVSLFVVSIAAAGAPWKQVALRPLLATQIPSLVEERRAEEAAVEERRVAKEQERRRRIAASNERHRSKLSLECSPERGDGASPEREGREKDRVRFVDEIDFETMKRKVVRRRKVPVAELWTRVSELAGGENLTTLRKTGAAVCVSADGALLYVHGGLNSAAPDQPIAGTDSDLSDCTPRIEDRPDAAANAVPSSAVSDVLYVFTLATGRMVQVPHRTGVFRSGHRMECVAPEVLVVFGGDISGSPDGSSVCVVDARCGISERVAVASPPKALAQGSLLWHFSRPDSRVWLTVTPDLENRTAATADSDTTDSSRKGTKPPSPERTTAASLDVAPAVAVVVERHRQTDGNVHSGADTPPIEDMPGSDGESHGQSTHTEHDASTVTNPERPGTPLTLTSPQVRRVPPRAVQVAVSAAAVRWQTVTPEDDPAAPPLPDAAAPVTETDEAPIAALEAELLKDEAQDEAQDEAPTEDGTSPDLSECPSSSDASFVAAPTFDDLPSVSATSSDASDAALSDSFQQLLAEEAKAKRKAAKHDSRAARRSDREAKMAERVSEWERQVAAAEERGARHLERRRLRAEAVAAQRQRRQQRAQMRADAIAPRDGAQGEIDSAPSATPSAKAEPNPAGKYDSDATRSTPDHEQSAVTEWQDPKKATVQRKGRPKTITPGWVTVSVEDRLVALRLCQRNASLLTFHRGHWSSHRCLVRPMARVIARPLGTFSQPPDSVHRSNATPAPATASSAPHPRSVAPPVREAHAAAYAAALKQTAAAAAAYHASIGGTGRPPTAGPAIGTAAERRRTGLAPPSEELGRFMDCVVDSAKSSAEQGLFPVPPPRPLTAPKPFPPPRLIGQAPVWSRPRKPPSSTLPSSLPPLNNATFLGATGPGDNDDLPTSIPPTQATAPHKDGDAGELDHSSRPVTAQAPSPFAPPLKGDSAPARPEPAAPRITTAQGNEPHYMRGTATQASFDKYALDGNTNLWHYDGKRRRPGTARDPIVDPKERQRVADVAAATARLPKEIDRRGLPVAHDGGVKCMRTVVGKDGRTTREAFRVPILSVCPPPQRPKSPGRRERVKLAGGMQHALAPTLSVKRRHHQRADRQKTLEEAAPDSTTTPRREVDADAEGDDEGFVLPAVRSGRSGHRPRRHHRGSAEHHGQQDRQEEADLAAARNAAKKRGVSGKAPGSADEEPGPHGGGEKDGGHSSESDVEPMSAPRAVQLQALEVLTARSTASGGPWYAVAAMRPFLNSVVCSVDPVVAPLQVVLNDALAQRQARDYERRRQACVEDRHTRLEAARGHVMAASDKVARPLQPRARTETTSRRQDSLAKHTRRMSASVSCPTSSFAPPSPSPKRKRRKRAPRGGSEGSAASAQLSSVAGEASPPRSPSLRTSRSSSRNRTTPQSRTPSAAHSTPPSSPRGDTGHTSPAPPSDHDSTPPSPATPASPPQSPIVVKPLASPSHHSTPAARDPRPRNAAIMGPMSGADDGGHIARHRADCFFCLEECCRAIPHLTGLDLAHITLGPLDVEILAAMVDNNHTLVLIENAHQCVCTDQCTKGIDPVVEAARRNKERNRQRRSERREQRALEQKYRGEIQAALAVKINAPLMRRRRLFSADCLAKHVLLGEQHARSTLLLAHRFYRRGLSLQWQEGLVHALQLEAAREALEALLAAVESAEASAREVAQREASTEWSQFAKREREARRRATAVVVARMKEHRLERDTVERAERESRTKLRSAEEEFRKQAMQRAREDIKQQRELERRQHEAAQAAAAKAKAEMEARQQAEWEMQRAMEEARAQRERDMVATVEREAKVRAEAVDDQEAAARTIHLAFEDGRRRVEVLLAQRDRASQRRDCAVLPVALGVSRWRKELRYHEGCDGVPIFDIDARLGLDVPTPDYMSTALTDRQTTTIATAALHDVAVTTAGTAAYSPYAASVLSSAPSPLPQPGLQHTTSFAVGADGTKERVKVPKTLMVSASAHHHHARGSGSGPSGPQANGPSFSMPHRRVSSLSVTDDAMSMASGLSMPQKPGIAQGAASGGFGLDASEISANDWIDTKTLFLGAKFTFALDAATAALGDEITFSDVSCRLVPCNVPAPSVGADFAAAAGSPTPDPTTNGVEHHLNPDGPPVHVRDFVPPPTGVFASSTAVPEQQSPPPSPIDRSPFMSPSGAVPPAGPGVSSVTGVVGGYSACVGPLATDGMCAFAIYRRTTDQQTQAHVVPSLPILPRAPFPPPSLTNTVSALSPQAVEGFPERRSDARARRPSSASMGRFTGSMNEAMSPTILPGPPTPPVIRADSPGIPAVDTSDVLIGVVVFANQGRTMQLEVAAFSADQTLCTMDGAFRFASAAVACRRSGHVVPAAAPLSTVASQDQGDARMRSEVSSIGRGPAFVVTGPVPPPPPSGAVNGYVRIDARTSVPGEATTAEPSNNTTAQAAAGLSAVTQATSQSGRTSLAPLPGPGALGGSFTNHSLLPAPSAVTASPTSQRAGSTDHTADTFQPVTIGSGVSLAAATGRPMVTTVPLSILGRAGVVPTVCSLAALEMYGAYLPLAPTATCGAVVSHWKSRFTVSAHSTVLELSPTARDVVYNEGQGEGLIFDGGQLTVRSPVPSLQDATLTIDAGPLQHPLDNFGLSLASPIEEDRGELRVGPIVVAFVTRRGIFGADSRRDATVGMPTRCELSLTKSCTAKHLHTLISTLVFRNHSQNPSEQTRQMEVALRFHHPPHFAHVVVAVHLRCVDDPTLVDFGPSGTNVIYRAPMPLPPRLEHHVQQPRFFFAGNCDVFDVDTDEFTGGYLSVKVLDSTACDYLQFHERPMPAFVDPDLNLRVADEAVVEGGEGKVVASPSGKVATYVERAQNWVFFQFAKASIEQVAVLLRSVEYRYDNVETLMTGEAPNCLIEVMLVVGQATPVRAVCNVKRGTPLLTVPAGSARFAHTDLEYDQQEGPVRLCHFDPTTNDAGWDGGWIHATFLTGHTADDILALSSDPNISHGAPIELVAPASDEEAQPLRTWRTGERHPRRGADPNSRPGTSESVHSRHDEWVPESSPLLAAVESAQRRRELRHRLDASLADEFGYNGADGSVFGAETQVVKYKGQRVGVAHSRPGSLWVRFDESYDLRQTQRSQMCSIHRDVPAAILRRLTYENTSLTPQELKKVVTITANDGLPQCTVGTVDITVHTKEDVTELHRIASGPREFRSKSEQDLRGFCPFDDVTVYDNETMLFHGGSLFVDVVSGGDPQGDQLGFLCLDEQRRRDPSAPIVTVSDLGEISFHGEPVGTVVFDAPNADGTSSIAISFWPAAPLSSAPHTTVLSPALSRRLSDVPPSPVDTGAATPFGAAPFNPEEFGAFEQPSVAIAPARATSFALPQQAAGAAFSTQASIAIAPVPKTRVCVTVQVLQRILRVVTYTNKAQVVQPGLRTYTVLAGMPGYQGKIKVPLAVSAPLLFNPDVDSETTFREKGAPVFIAPHLVFNLPEQQLVKIGVLSVTLLDEQEMLELDRESNPLYGGSNSTGSMHIGSNYVGRLSRTTSAISAHSAKGRSSAAGPSFLAASGGSALLSPSSQPLATPTTPVQLHLTPKQPSKRPSRDPFAQPSRPQPTFEFGSQTEIPSAALAPRRSVMLPVPTERQGYDEHDHLDVSLFRHDTLQMTKDGSAVVLTSGAFGCSVRATAKEIAFGFDYTSRMTARHVQQLLRCVTFRNSEVDPQEASKRFRVQYTTAEGAEARCHGTVRLKSNDQPSEIFFRRPTCQAVRLSPAVRVAADADVLDPDTSVFDARTFIDISIRNALATDHVLLLGAAGQRLEDTITVADLPQPRRKSSVPGIASGRSMSLAGQGSIAVSPATSTGRKKSTPRAPFAPPGGIVARVQRGSNSSLRVQVALCDLAQLQAIVRCVACRFDLNTRDRAAHKGIFFELRSGTASSHASLAVEVLAPLVDTTSGSTVYAPTGRSGAIDVAPRLIARSSHFAEGGSVEFRLEKGAPSGCKIMLSTKLGLQTKASKGELFLDREKVGGIEPDKTRMRVVTTISPGESAASIVQKILSSVCCEVPGSAMASGGNSASVPINLVVRDKATDAMQEESIVIQFTENSELIAIGGPNTTAVQAATGTGIQPSRRRFEQRRRTQFPGPQSSAAFGSPAPKQRSGSGTGSLGHGDTLFASRSRDK